jgi:hypothetical protein
MGIKDWFGSGADKKKDAFREEAKEALKGKLTPGSAAKLAEVARRHEIEDAGDDKTKLRRDVFNEAVGQVRAQGKLSSAEVEELAKIQKFLALRDDQVERTKWDLAKLRTLTEIRKGKLPAVPANSAAMRGVQLVPGETAHYAVQVEVLDRASGITQPGVKAKWAAPYEVNSAKAHSLPAEGNKELGEGYLFITNKRLFFKGENRSAAVEYSPRAGFFIYRDGIRLERNVGHTLLRFKSRSDETAEIVGELLAALMR